MGWASDPEHWHRWEEDLGEVRPEHYEIAESTPPRRQVMRATAGRSPFEGTLELSDAVGGTRVRHTVNARRRTRCALRSSWQSPAGAAQHAPPDRGAARAAEGDGGAGGRV